MGIISRKRFAASRTETGLAFTCLAFARRLTEKSIPRVKYSHAVL